jgi:hypothetical protein
MIAWKCTPVVWDFKWRFSVNKFFGMMLLLVGAAGVASASAVPEIDAGSATSAVALLSGVLLIIRGRRRK